MRMVAQVFVSVTTSAASISLDEVARVIRGDGWVQNRKSTSQAEEWASFQSEGTPLILVTCINAEFPEILQLGLVEKWWRCALAGGWWKRGYLPEDIFGRISSRLRASGWAVEHVLP